MLFSNFKVFIMSTISETNDNEISVNFTSVCLIL